MDFRIKKRLLGLCLGGFVLTNIPLSATVTVKIVRAPIANTEQEKNKQNNNRFNKQIQLKQSIIKAKTDISNKQSFGKNNSSDILPQQGGLPEFVPTGNFQTVKGEGEGAGDAPIIEQRGGMPEFNITGYASICPVFANPSISYYDGSKTPDIIGSNISTKSDSKTKFDQAGLGFDFEGGLNVDANLMLANDVKAGGCIEIQAVKDDFALDKGYVYFDCTKFGKVFLGNTKGPDSTFDVGGQSLIGGGAGINGTILSNFDYATAVFVPRAIVGNSNKASKIFVSTRDFYGLRLGIGFTPDTKLHGHVVRDRTNGDSSNGNNPGCFTKGKDGKEKPNGRYNFSIGLRYEKEIAPDFTIRCSAVFVTESTQKLKTLMIEGKKIDANSKGEIFVDPEYKVVDEKQVIDEDKSSKPQTKEIQLNNAKSFMCSLGLTFKQVTISGGYLYCGKSRLPNDTEYKTTGDKSVIFPQFMCGKQGNAGRAWNIGARWDWKKWAIAGVYWNTSRQITKDEKTKGHIFTGTVDYLFKPGFKLFFEVDYLNTTSSPSACVMYNLISEKKVAISKQSGFAILAGCTIQF